MRLQKYLSQAGLCSRREAESRILAGRVTVNGRPAVLGESVEPGRDRVAADGREISLPGARTYIMLHKPRGYVTTLRDEKGRPTVAELVREAGTRLFPVGRLDMDSEGLLIMTDDGEAANRLMHPSHGVSKTYRVWVSGEDPARAAERLRSPLEHQGVRYMGAEVELRRVDGEVAVLDLTITEGKNREVRNMCAAVGLAVRRLLRMRQGELRLGSLPAGSWRYLTEKETEFLRRLTE